MIAGILRDAGKDPTVIIGSLLIGEKSNFIAGQSNLFLVEACEYRRSFLNINPNILVITNIDEDHLDYYKDIADIKNAFRELVMKVPADGFIVCDPSDKNIADVVVDINAKVINYADFFNPSIKLKVPGLHNKKDAASAFAVASILAVSYTEANTSLEAFPGTWRRFEYKGKLTNGALIYDDYAHHPVEIVATLSGFRELYPKNDGWKVTVVFQPHLFSRTKLLLDDFAKSFADADAVLVLPIYHAREEDDGTISAEILATEINKHNNNAQAFIDFASTEKYLDIWLPNMNSKDIIVTMGAGEAWKVGDYILRK
jgi:UDP-N-acetylmuramate--alanine ligase